jgi:L-2-hydroxyglutarate oxidase LhgO
MTQQRVGVLGAGIVGLAIARRLAHIQPDAQITVIDKESQVGRHQSGHNSGVAHAGVYYAPGSLKARLCRRGVTLLKEFCAERGVAYEECGKLIVARHASELRRLDELERRARANGVPGVARLQPAAMREIEPQVSGIGALHSPHTAIVDFRAVTQAYGADVERTGGQIRLGFEVTEIRRTASEVRVGSDHGDHLVFDRLIVCGGLQSDRLAKLAGQPGEPSIVPFRGEYYRLIPARRDLVRGLIYPVPDLSYPFLGVHFTRRVDGEVDIGPNAVLALSREGYRRRDVSLRDMAEVLGSPGFRRLARRHWRMGLKELRSSLSRSAFIADARAFIPELRAADVEPATAGVRAQAVDPDGSLVDDFRITISGPIAHVRNAPSPAATASLAIAEYVVHAIRGKEMTGRSSP